MFRTAIGWWLTASLLCTSYAAAERQLGEHAATNVEETQAVASQLTHPDPTSILESYGRLPMAFEKNHGQAADVFDFIARGAGYRVGLSSVEATLDLASRHSKQSSPPRSIRMRFVGARQNATASGADPAPGKINYFQGGAPSKHFTDIEAFTRISYADIYPGIDVVYYGNQRHLEYDLSITPGADLTQIRMAFEGPDRIEIDKHGNLLLLIEGGEMTLQKPVIYQLVKGKRQIIDGQYIHLAENEVGFKVSSYEAQAPLIIDPVLSYSTYLGGSSDDVGTTIAVDAAGNAYLAGYTYSTNFPILNAYDRSLGHGDEDVFITKLDPTGSALVYSTYLGSARDMDIATGIAVDDAGNAYVTGMTSGSGFPVTAGAYQTGQTGGGAFAAKLSATGNALVYSTYILGATNPRIAIDTAHNVYMTGSATPAFSTTAGAFQTAIANPDGRSTFIAKLNAAGTAMEYATFVDGSTQGQGIAVDGQGNAYVAGATGSDAFPTVSPLQSSRQGAADAFVLKLNPTGTALGYSTYLGGTQDDWANAIAVDTQGNAYVTGETYSSDFPVRNAFQPVKAGRFLINAILGSAFVAKLAPTGDALRYSSFLGGEICPSYCRSVFGGSTFSGDVTYGIALDASDHAYVTGLARSYTFPLVDSLVPRKQQDSENSLFVTKIGLAGNLLLYSTFVRTGYIVYGDSLQSGVPYGAGNAITVDSVGNAYVASEDYGNSGLSITTGAYQTVNKGLDAVAFKLTAPSLGMTLASSANPVSSQAETALTATVSDLTLTGDVIFMDGATQLGSAPLSSGRATLSTTLSPGIRRLTAVLRSNGTTADSALLYLVVNTGLACN